MNNKESQEKIRRPLMSIWFFAAYSILLAAGYGITSLIYSFTGRPPEILMHIFSGLAAVILIGTIFGISRLIFDHSNKHEPHRIVHSRLLTAMDQIAHGNFDVLIDPKDAGTHYEFANALNEMSKNLGTLETMRQDFISNVSHEIQSPLTSICGFASLLQNDALPDEQRKHYASVIEVESKRLSCLSENLLKLSALESPDTNLSIQEYRLDKQLETVTLTMEPQWLAKNISVEVEFPKTLYLGDDGLLSQVWVNLLHNAIKFTPDGGLINIVLTSDDNYVCVKISDTGVGLTSEDQMHIFERFYKVDKARDRTPGGNGLGLSLVKKIVELHGGRITVESEISKGTTFQIFLPCLH